MTEDELQIAHALRLKEIEMKTGLCLIAFCALVPVALIAQKNLSLASLQFICRSFKAQGL